MPWARMTMAAPRGAQSVPSRLSDRDDAPLPEELDRLGIVDEGAVGVDGLLSLVAGHVDDHVHGPLHPHAEPGGFRQPDAHTLSF